MRSFFTVLFSLVLGGLLFAQDQTARLQVIHNAADPAAEVVDLYVNGDLFYDDFKFRTATPFVDVPAGVDLELAVAPGGSNGVQDSIAVFTVNFAENETYVAVANGVVGNDFAANPDGRNINFTIFARDNVKEKGLFPFLVDALILHGATDAPKVDLLVSIDKSDNKYNSTQAADMDLPTVSTWWGYKWLLANNIAYGDFKGYKRLLPYKFIIDVTPADDNLNVVASFKANLSGLGGGAAVVFASGFLSPAANNNGPAFGLFAALPTGDVVELPAVQMEEPMARLQVIHNAADPAAGVVDLYVNGELFYDDFGFRQATPFVDVPAEVELSIGVAPGTSSGAGDIIATFPVTFADKGSYIAVANGVLGEGFAPNPDDRSIDFTIFAADEAREKAEKTDKVDVRVLHGATDAPGVNILGYGLVIQDARYGDITDYVSLKAERNWLVVYVPYPSLSLVGIYKADLSGLGGGAAFVFASGFVSPADNSNGPAFGLYAALPDGNVIQLPELFSDDKMDIMNDIMVANGFEQISSLESDIGSNVVTDFALEQNYPNPFNPGTTIRFALPKAANVSLKVYDVNGRMVADLISGMQNAGRYQVDFNAENLASGIYMYVLRAGEFSEIKRMTLLK